MLTRGSHYITIPMMKRGTKRLWGVVLGALLLLFSCPTCLWGQQEQTISKETSVVKVSGYVQTQWQVGDSLATPNVGTVLEPSSSMISRIGIRRGRLKLDYNRGIADVVFSLDLTERGVHIKDAYLALSLPSLGSSSLTVGLFSTPFGYEVCYSSSKRESPERSAIVRTLFPGERNVGLNLALQASKNSGWYPLKMELALLSGNGISSDADNSLDLLARLSAEKSFLSEHLSVGLALSGYWGSVPQGTVSHVYKVSDSSYERVGLLVAGSRGRVPRRYRGVDLQGRLRTAWGETRLISEVIFGIQPALEGGSKSVVGDNLPKDDLYIRPFLGGYAQLTQTIGKSPCSVVGKYEWYDPNREFPFGAAKNSGDRAASTWGVGILWDFSSSLRLLAYYQQDWSEQKQQTVEGQWMLLRDQMGTIRLQYKF